VIREVIDKAGAPARTLPERLPRLWRAILLGGDLLAVLSACYLAGMPPAVGPAACAIVCGTLALCDAYRTTYAVVWRDEVYHVAVGCALAAVPLFALLHFVTGLPDVQPIVAFFLAAPALAAIHAALHAARVGATDPPVAQSEYVSPEAQWRLARPLVLFWKRWFDVALAAAGVLVTLPVTALAAALIAIESGMPVFFCQERVGRGGLPFRMFKFRTMRSDAGTQWALRGDSRITRVGAILRRTSVDELPQLLNVLRGDMSLVGPRPEMPDFARQFRRRIPHYDERSIVRPGLTGWAQIRCKRNLEPDDMPGVVPYDLFYVENASPVLDAIIVAKTAAEFLFHRAV